mgnify:CR=1 FL=1
MVPIFADWCVIHLLQDDGSLSAATVASASGEIPTGAAAVDVGRVTPAALGPLRRRAEALPCPLHPGANDLELFARIGHALAHQSLLSVDRPRLF